MSRALIVVDVQRDFCEGGSLGVPGGNKVAKDIKEYVLATRNFYDFVVFTKDWHKPGDDNGGHFGNPPDYIDTWPVHCEADTEGASFHPEILEAYYDVWRVSTRGIFYKGYGKPDYSGFQGANDRGTTLEGFLRLNMVQKVHIVGIAGEHCVKQTAIDGIKLGFMSVQILPTMIASIGGAPSTWQVYEFLENLKRTK